MSQKENTMRIDGPYELCPYIEDCSSFIQDICSGECNDNIQVSNCEKYRNYMDYITNDEITDAEIEELF
jgi:hypothetical protein